MSRCAWAVFLAAILGLVGVGGTPRPAGAASSGTVGVKLSDIPVGKVIQVGSVKFVKVGADQYLAINLCPDGSTYMAEYKGCVANQTTWKTAGEYTFTAPESGYYVLEVWGAQGGYSRTDDDTHRGGYGGYSIGAVSMSSGNKIFVNVGGRGKYCINSVSGNTNQCGENGGYNGGAKTVQWTGGPCNQTTWKGCTFYGSGGGASHVSSVSGELKNLVAYKDTGGANISKEIFIVSGGGAGASSYRAADNRNDVFDLKGGNAGGINGSKSVINYTDGRGNNNCQVGTQVLTTSSTISYGTFGLGGLSSLNTNYFGPGGGGGWYGGGAEEVMSCGGSGYIGSSKLVSLSGFPKHMTCYQCSTSTEAATYTISNTCVNAEPVMDCSKTGDGAARITQLSVYLGI